ncbi:hypothetical protein HMPREF1211_03783 [Streptomyces sp. HGB0020]|nr:hypothetical protein HMPREF1211_03783 [Streptomyces sp. HGB0020]
MPGTRGQSRSAGAAAAARTGSPRCRRQTHHAPTTGGGYSQARHPGLGRPRLAQADRRPHTTSLRLPAHRYRVGQRFAGGDLERRAPEAEAHPNCSHDSTRPLTRMTAANPPRTDHRPKAKPGIQAWALPTARSSRPETTHHEPPAPGTPTSPQPRDPPDAISNVTCRRRSTLQQQPWQHAPAHQIGAGEPTTDRPQAKAKPPASGPKPGPRLTHADPRPLTTSLPLPSPRYGLSRATRRMRSRTSRAEGEAHSSGGQPPRQHAPAHQDGGGESDRHWPSAPGTPAPGRPSRPPSAAPTCQAPEGEPSPGCSPVRIRR